MNGCLGAARCNTCGGGKAVVYVTIKSMCKDIMSTES